MSTPRSAPSPPGCGTNACGPAEASGISLFPLHQHMLTRCLASNFISLLAVGGRAIRGALNHEGLCGPPNQHPVAPVLMPLYHPVPLNLPSSTAHLPLSPPTGGCQQCHQPLVPSNQRTWAPSGARVCRDCYRKLERAREKEKREAKRRQKADTRRKNRANQRRQKRDAAEAAAAEAAAAEAAPAAAEAPQVSALLSLSLSLFPLLSSYSVLSLSSLSPSLSLSLSLSLPLSLQP